MQPTAAEPSTDRAQAPAERPRNDAIDIVRGLVMVVMALDHARNMVMGHGNPDPLDLANTTLLLYSTRWITHFCAPTFVLLAGVGAGLSRSKKSAPELARFLVTRGLWLVLLEVTVVSVGFFLNVHMTLLQVIWAIGWSMVLLAPLVYLPPLYAGVFGIVMCAGHNLLDGIHAQRFGSLDWLWHVAHENGLLHQEPHRVILGYPLVPWVGVMAAGYALGCLLPRDAHERRRLLVRLGLALTVQFVVVRAINVYGDPVPWTSQPRGPVFTVLSFLKCEKYPPSLDYLLMTLGPALLAIAAFELRPLNRLTSWMRTFGRVPLFFYLCHLYVLHLVTIAMFLPSLRDPAFRARLFDRGAPGWGLAPAYLAWIVAVVALYPLCRWYEKLKQRSRNPWLSYL